MTPPSKKILLNTLLFLIFFLLFYLILFSNSYSIVFLFPLLVLFGIGVMLISGGSSKEGTIDAPKSKPSFVSNLLRFFLAVMLFYFFHAFVMYMTGK